MTDEIKLVSERDPKEIAAQDARRELTWATKELAANILRVIAGAGKSHTLHHQSVAVLTANERFKKLTDPLAPELAMEQALRSLDWFVDDPRWESDIAEVDYAKNEIVRSALRVVAAQLCAQPMQKSQSDNQLVDAIYRYNQARKARREA